MWESLNAETYHAAKPSTPRLPRRDLAQAGSFYPRRDFPHQLSGNHFFHFHKRLSKEIYSVIKKSGVYDDIYTSDSDVKIPRLETT
jgi:hypothetical protein